MRKITEVLRLKAAGMSSRDVAASVGAGKTIIYEYLARAEAAGLAWPLPEDLDEAALEAKLFPPPTAELAPAYVGRHQVGGRIKVPLMGHVVDMASSVAATHSQAPWPPIRQPVSSITTALNKYRRRSD